MKGNVSVFCQDVIGFDDEHEKKKHCLPSAARSGKCLWPITRYYGLYFLLLEMLMFTIYIQGVPKKTGILSKIPITGLKRGLKIKVGWVLKNSGNFQSNEHRNFVFSSKNDWDIKAQSWLPSQ